MNPQRPLDRPGNARRPGARRRGGGFFMFLVVLLPLTLLGVSLVADFSRAILAGRQATNAADTIAMAAATAFDDQGDADRLNRVEAQRRAQDMFDHAVATGMIPAQFSARLGPVDVSADRRTVTVTVIYDVPPFVVADAIVPGKLPTITGRAVRAAQVCLPDDPERVDGAGCAYPTL